MTKTNEEVDRIVEDPWLAPLFEASMPIESKKEALRTVLTSLSAMVRKDTIEEAIVTVINATGNTTVTMNAVRALRKLKP